MSLALVVDHFLVSFPCLPIGSRRNWHWLLHQCRLDRGRHCKHNTLLLLARQKQEKKVSRKDRYGNKESLTVPSSFSLVWINAAWHEDCKDLVHDTEREKERGYTIAVSMRAFENVRRNAKYSPRVDMTLCHLNTLIAESIAVFLVVELTIFEDTILECSCSRYTGRISLDQRHTIIRKRIERRRRRAGDSRDGKQGERERSVNHDEGRKEKRKGKEYDGDRNQKRVSVKEEKSP